MAGPRDPPSEETGLPSGTMVGEYRIEGLLGEGGMGTVYAAVHPVIGKRVAIKVLSPLVTHDPSVVQRFALEARAVNAIAHPNIVDIFSFGQLPGGRHYFVMERLEGETLGARIARAGPLSAPEALPPFRDVGRALAAAHRNQIIHRDLKPENIMISVREDGALSAKLLDFGVAKLLDLGATAASAHRTRAGVVVGTPQYMAPEQCLGGAVDARTDLYALGVVLFEALTGRWPFEGATIVEIWQGHIGKLPPPLADIMPADAPSSAELEALVMQLLAKNPANRLQSAAQFCEALDVIAPTLGAPRARKARPPRLDAPLVPPTQSLMMTSPGGLAAPSQEELARLAAAFEGHFGEVVTLDGRESRSEEVALAPPGMIASPTPTIDLDMTTEPTTAPGPAREERPPGASGAEAARFEPPAASQAPLDLRLEQTTSSAPFRRTTLTATRPALRQPGTTARPPQGPRLWVPLMVVLVLIAAAVAALWRFR